MAVILKDTGIVVILVDEEFMNTALDTPGDAHAMAKAILSQ